jgi:hypothetical protein
VPSLLRHITHQPCSLFFLFHLVWPYLTISDYCRLTQTSPLMQTYWRQQMRTFLSHSAIAQVLPSPFPPAGHVQPLLHHHAKFLGCTLLSFDFHYGDLLRWMGLEYTQCFCNTSMSQCAMCYNTHVSVTRIVIHIPFLRKGSVPHSAIGSTQDPQLCPSLIQ